jgi:FkbM family methyltransferase
LVRSLLDRWRWLRRHPAFRRRPGSVLIRLLLWRLHSLMGRPAEVHLPESNVRLWLPPEWRGVAKLIFAFRDDYEPELAFLRRYLKNGMTMVDVGACYGIYTTVGARGVGERGRVLAFEPAKRSFEVLQKNTAGNRFGNVRLFRLALANCSGSSWLRHAPDPGRNALRRVSVDRGDCERVSLAKLDEVLESEKVSRVDLIKIDAEGAEELVMQGGEWAFRTWRPVIIFEVNTEAAASLGLRATGAAELLRSLEYGFFSAGASGELAPTEGPPDGGNVVALPREHL